MPARFLCVAIVVFWLATTGWLCMRDITPALRAGQPPPFTIDLADEAQEHALKIRWAILRDTASGETRIGRAKTWITYRAADDTFELHNDTDGLSLGSGILTVRVPHMTTVYRVRPDGSLVAMTAKIDANLRTPLSNLDIKAIVDGVVREGQFVARGALEALGWGAHQLDLPPVPVSPNGTVLNPLHPVNRIAGLRPGQHWRMPLVDPLADAVAAQVARDLPAFKPTPRFLNAQVLAEPQILMYEGREVPCLVIEYHGDDDLAARTFVRQSDGLVLRQEAMQKSVTGAYDRVILQRE
jgi:hypothetical protein